MKFILWDPKDGQVPRNNGVIDTNGTIGRVTEDNVYMTQYPGWPAGAPKLTSLRVGDVIRGVRYGLSGECGYYDIYRVE